MVSPKCHPELAGLGIEYSWGMMKKAFRRNNDCVYKHLHENVTKSMTKEQLPMASILRFSRRTREYGRAYLSLASNTALTSEDVGYDVIEKMRKVQKTHRCILDMEKSFLDGIQQTMHQDSDCGAGGDSVLSSTMVLLHIILSVKPREQSQNPLKLQPYPQVKIQKLFVCSCEYCLFVFICEYLCCGGVCHCFIVQFSIYCVFM